MITSLIKSLELFLSLKNKLFYYELRTKSKNRQTEIISEIEKLRSAGSSGDADRADLLRADLKAERSELEYLSAFYFKSKEGSTSADS